MSQFSSGVDEAPSHFSGSRDAHHSADSVHFTILHFPDRSDKGLKGGTVRFKSDKIKIPEMHLGAKLQKRSTDRIECWFITSEERDKAAVHTTKTSISKEN